MKQTVRYGLILGAALAVGTGVAIAGMRVSSAAQERGDQNGGGQACYAGPYVCPMDRPVATGGSCYCLGNGSQRVWGRAN